MTSIDPSTIAICMITKYPKWYQGGAKSPTSIDKVRGDLALKTIKTAVEKGCQTLVGYHPGSVEFNKQLDQIPGVILLKRTTKKSSPSKRQLIKKASDLNGVKVIVLTEPEKLSFIKDCLVTTVSPIINDEADVVIPKREEKLFCPHLSGLYVHL